MLYLEFGMLTDATKFILCANKRGLIDTNCKRVEVVKASLDLTGQILILIKEEYSMRLKRKYGEFIFQKNLLATSSQFVCTSK